MITGRPRDAHKEQRWRQLLLRWRHSGLSVRAFCQQHHLAQASFYAWRRTLARREQRAQARPPAPPVTFVPLHVQHDQAPARPDLEVLLGNGRLVRIPAGFDPTGLRALLAVLEETSCSA